MNSTRITRYSAAGLLLAAFTLGAMVPAAEANHDSWKRYKHGGPRYVRVVRQDYAPRGYVEFHSHSSSAGPAIAGFIGGVALATILNNHASHDCDDRYGYVAAPPPEPEYYYYDPYCHERFASLDACASHTRRCDHPRVVRMIDASSGQCMRTYERENGRWQEWDGDDQGWDDQRDDQNGGGCGR